MNNMTKQEIRKLYQLAQVVGTFIRYWGFRNIHGEIWTVLFLVKTPMAAVEIGRTLKASKALVSPALKQLLEEGLIIPAPSENSKIKRYQAVENVSGVIRDVLRRREQLMMADAAAKHLALAEESTPDGGLDQHRLEALGTMIQTANLGLASLVNEDAFWGS